MLHPSSKNSREVRFSPIHLGISPESLFPPTSSVCSCAQSCKDGLSSPERLLLLNLSHSIGDCEHIELGIPPDRLLLDSALGVSASARRVGRSPPLQTWSACVPHAQ